MTLIGVATYGDRAEFITDIASYSLNGSSLGRTTKFVVVSHLDAAVVTQGSGEFGDLAKLATLKFAEQASSFDELTDGAPGWLLDAWELVRESETHLTDSTVILVGYSPRHQRFVTYVFASESDFAPVDPGEMFLMPTPWTMRPSTMEQRRLLATDGLGDRAREVLAGWADKPAVQRPGSASAWESLARTVREQRALESWFRVIVAGALLHTTLRRHGESSTRQLFEFDDHGEEFLRLIAYTQHPQAQLMACHCGSGKRFLDCHLAPHLDDPCGCGTGALFRDCCAVT